MTINGQLKGVIVLYCEILDYEKAEKIGYAIIIYIINSGCISLDNTEKKFGS